MTDSVKKQKSIPIDPTADDELWDNRKLGADESFVRVSKQKTNTRLDEGLGLQMVSMRLPQDAIDKFKALARKQGLGYQPFIRQILMNYLRDSK